MPSITTMANRSLRVRMYSMAELTSTGVSSAYSMVSCPNFDTTKSLNAPSVSSFVLRSIP